MNHLPTTDNPETIYIHPSDPIDLDVENLVPCAQNPYRVQTDGDFRALAGSIRERGILNPLIVRPKSGATETYEVISGHRRLRAAKELDLRKVPCLVRDLDDDAAAITLVDSNLHRQNLLPSEQAAAIKMKFEALQHQGKASAQNAPKLTVEEVGAGLGISKDKVKRLKKLNDLEKPLLDMVDRGKIGLISGYDLAHLSSEQQKLLVEYIARSERYPPTGAQAKALKRAAGEKLDSDVIKAIMSAEPTKVKERAADSNEQYTVKDAFGVGFPDGTTAQAMVEVIRALLKRHQSEIGELLQQRLPVVQADASQTDSVAWNASDNLKNKLCKEIEVSA